MTKIAIADDEAAVVSSTSAILRLFGYDVVSVAHASEILSMLRRERPDLLLQDVRMPGLELNGHLAAIRADPELATLPVIVFTANVDAQELWRSAGVSDVVEKPFDPYALRDLIEKHRRR